MTWELTIRTHTRLPELAEDWICLKPSSIWKMLLHINPSFHSGDTLVVQDIMPWVKTSITPMVDILKSLASTSFPSSITWNQMPWLNLSTQKSALLPMLPLKELSAAEEELTELTVVFLHTFLLTATLNSTWPRSLSKLPELIRKLFLSPKSKPPRPSSLSENEEVLSIANG